VRAGDVLAPPPTTTFEGKAGGDNHPGTDVSELMFGLAGNDTLVGNGGADTLDGGTGTDFLTGGTGNDTYVIDVIGDRVSEFGGDADDRIIASISIDLTAKDSKTNVPLYENIEHVTLIGSAALNATGSAAANMLIGNDGANILDGAAGDDTLIGGVGNDTYKVDSTADVVIELPGGGIDTVLSTAFSFTLGANVENLTLTGSDAANAFGNDLANKITDSADSNVSFDFRALFGNGGDDTLVGNGNADHLFGGTGADSMVGGAGNDLYDVDDVGDKVGESGPATDIDTVQSSITYTLGANLEDMRLVGTANIDGTGNSLNNNIDVTGNSGDNVLSGLAGNDTLFAGTGNDLVLGGDGNDLLFLNIDGGLDTAVGGAGSDTFQLFQTFALDGLDVIADFTGGPGGDVIDLAFVLGNFDFASDNINDFLKTSTANGNTTIQLDQDGTANGVNFVDVVVLQGVSTDVAGLVTNGNLILE
jgi:Ca2+-binding RTX toxin-like protein